MSIDVNKVNNFGIDKATAAQVTQEILARANAKTVDKTVDLSQADLSKFRRPELGTDLYSRNVCIDAQRQIAISNAGLNVNLQGALAATQYLNNQAAAAHYGNLHKNVDGKVHIHTNNIEGTVEREVAQLPKTLELSKSMNLSKDKHGSGNNPFYSRSAKEQSIEDEVQYLVA